MKEVNVRYKKYGKTCFISYKSLTEAWHDYLKRFVTLGDRWYYWRLNHKSLNSVTDEQLMYVIFRNACKRVKWIEVR